MPTDLRGEVTEFVCDYLTNALPLSGITLEADGSYLRINIRGWKVSNHEAFDVLKNPLAHALHDLAKAPLNPAVSYRNFHALTAVLARKRRQRKRKWSVGQSDAVVILIGYNVSPWRGVQRRCAERGPGFRALFMALEVFGAVTVIEHQADDVTGLSSISGLRLVCDDCRYELPHDFGWRPQVRMLFGSIRNPRIQEETNLGRLLRSHRKQDDAAVRKVIDRANGRHR